MFTWDNFDPADSKIAKRSLLAFSIGTLMLGNITIVSEEFSILGLVVEVSQPRLIALGQLLSFFFLILYILKEAPNLFISFQLWAISRLKTKQSSQRRDLADSWGFDNFGPYEDSPDGEFKELEDKHKWEHDEVERRFGMVISWAKFIAETATKYFIPVTAGILAIFYPSSLDQFTSYVVANIP
ncbi:hypothetical protein [Roseobacter sp. CCS2]|uniref:hypothetical protein n=1 Tax=Roseobacter sp. CCS2 TaxID=391593 RepID=UPI0012EA67B5|nr:hypothetical protein [Roseobacter sp. CCS2]